MLFRVTVYMPRLQPRQGTAHGPEHWSRNMAAGLVKNIRLFCSFSRQCVVISRFLTSGILFNLFILII